MPQPLEPSLPSPNNNTDKNAQKQTTFLPEKPDQ